MMAPVERPTFALLGDPVEHSVSPAIHRAAFAALGIRADYERCRVDAARVPEAMRDWAATGGGGNVTLPHKRVAAETVERPSGAVAVTRACNCFWRDSKGRLAGDNTDVAGFLTAVGALLGGPPGSELAGARVLLLGAGGAARAVAIACLSSGVGRLDVLNRTTARAEEMVAELGSARPRVRERLRVKPSASSATGPYDLVVNATRLGLAEGDPLPFELHGIEIGAVMDLVYAPGETAWVRQARAAGVAALDGLEMVVNQAVLSLRCWFPGVRPPVRVMREAARMALEARSQPRTKADSG
ncbi:MAG: shikimate dehydrogenase family protein [Gemmatimonadota bacterium]